MRRVFVVAGETSGDRHAAALVSELRRRDASLQFTGLGGPQMQAAGVELLEDLTRYAVVGLVEVLTHLATFRRIFRTACRALDEQRPDLVILVDYPGFNLCLAHEAKRRGLRVVYYVSPQLWAWGAGRMPAIKRDVALMLVFFPFEESMYHEAGVPVRWVGHPLLDAVRVTRSRPEVLAAHQLSPTRPVIGLLPGSRAQEVTGLLPILGSAADQLARQIPGAQFVLMSAPGLAPDLYQRALARTRAPMTTPAHWDHDLLAACDLVLVASGTATLECALLERPMVIVYKTNPLTWWLGRRLVTLPYIGLVNVVAGRPLVPECLQGDATPTRIAEEALKILRSDQGRQGLQAGFRDVRNRLGAPGASARAADAILAVMPRH